MRAIESLLAHAGESHRRQVERRAERRDERQGEPAAPAPAAAPAAAEGGVASGPELLIGLLVLSGWLWLPLLRRAGIALRQRAK